MYTEKDYNDSLCHHGVKGQKWGVRRFQNADGSYTNAGIKRYGIKGSQTDKQKMNLAKDNYKMAKKQYNKDFNSWYNKSIAAYSPSERHRVANEIRYQKAIVSAGEMAIQKGKYLQAKGVAKNNPKTVAKGKYLVQKATVAKKYNSTILSELNKGSRWSEATKKHNEDRIKGNAQLKKYADEYSRKKANNGW